MKKVSSVTDTANDSGEFTDGEVAAGVKPTELLAGWFNTIQRELAAVVEGAGEELDPDNDEQIAGIIGEISDVINHYRNYGYPEWESGISYYEGAVVYYNGDLYLSLNDNNLGNIPGNDDSIWQSYIQREATEAEAIEGTGSTQVMTPRRVKSAASALDTALQAALTPYLLPVGAIVMWGSETPPDGWLELNGQEFDVEDNPKLALIYPDGVLPDYRGRFVRAWSNGSSIDADRGLGSFQDGAVQHHKHVVPWGELRIEGPFGQTAEKSHVGSDGLSSADDPYYFTNDGSDYNNNSCNDPGIMGDETRPTNVAAMYIIKTDLAEAENSGSTTPTALVISPATVTVDAGSTRQFTATVLPSSLADGYPVSWSVSDSSLGSIDSDGLYTATAGQSGTQTIIASLSTGLTATATVTQRIYLTSIVIGSGPAELLAGNSYTLAVTYSPTDYTETVNAASSDTSVATLATDGTLTISGAGSATLTLTGASSGVTASITITATEEVVPEVYLAIENNLSEFAAAGTQSTARDNLGLGDLATKDSLTASEVGAVPQASATLGTDDLDDVTSPGRKFQSLTSNATTVLHYPVALAGMLDVIKTTDTGIRQIYYPYNTTDVYHRYCEDATATTPTWSDWSLNGAGDFLAVENNLSDVADAAAARENLGVGYTISTDEAPADATDYAIGHVWYQAEE